MNEVVELFGIFLGMGAAVTLLSWGTLPPIAIKAAAAFGLSLLFGYPTFMATKFAYGFVGGLRKQ